MTIKSSISLTAEQHALARAQETEALCRLVSRGREGEFVTACEMNPRFERMIADKRRSVAGRTSGA